MMSSFSDYLNLHNTKLAFVLSLMKLTIFIQVSLAALGSRISHKATEKNSDACDATEHSPILSITCLYCTDVACAISFFYCHFLKVAARSKRD